MQWIGNVSFLFEGLSQMVRERTNPTDGLLVKDHFTAANYKDRQTDKPKDRVAKKDLLLRYATHDTTTAVFILLKKQQTKKEMAR